MVLLVNDRWNLAMTYEVSRSGPQTWNIALNREHWREQGKEKRSAIIYDDFLDCLSSTHCTDGLIDLSVR